MTIRTRFAPSPTGFLHIGGARTALYNWAWTRRHGGVFLLRIEDTDRARSTAASEAAVVDGLRWLGMDWDERLSRQSERGDLHRAAIETLLARDRAYRCVCTPDEIGARKQQFVATGAKWTYDGRCAEANHGPACGPHTVRLRVSKTGRLDWQDLVFGPSGQDAREIGDMVIRRSDGSPLYHLAVVVDDVDMRITHVIRGADHLNNTPFQLALYQALDAPIPQFAHLPLIVGADGRKLSKRRDHVSVQHFREAGYLPEALCTWLVRIGWSHGDQEIFSLAEIRALFSLEATHRSPGHADPQKLDWINQTWIKRLPAERLAAELRPFLAAATDADAAAAAGRDPGLLGLIDLLRERSKTLAEMSERARFFALPDAALAYDPKAVQKHWKPALRTPLAALRDALVALTAWEPAAIEAAFEATLAQHEGLGRGPLAQAVRVAVTGSAASPGIYETLAVLGRERTRVRLERALAAWPAAS
ncbi:glutamate--tRNA ligase [Myxococcota bacterium]|nr:glutamate--tRNA ligase [Myxococcota bacterium]